jgi:hypothetical protein
MFLIGQIIFPQSICVVAADCPEERGYVLSVAMVKPERSWLSRWMGYSLVAGGVKGNRICLSSGVPSADAGTVDVEAENPFSSFIAQSVMNFVVYCIIDAGTRRIISQSLRQPMKHYHVGQATATSLANNYISEITS